MAVNEKEINEQGEQFLHALRPKPAAPASPPVQREQEKSTKPNKKNEKNDEEVENYMETYIYDKSNLNFRKGPRQALINRDMHTTINRIVMIVGENETSVSQYINNVLAKHLEEHSELITRLLTEKFQPKI